MARLPKKLDDRPDVPMAPLIDCVFLLLIYFMVTSSIEKQEADISFQLPGTAEQSEPVDMPDEQIIEINEDHQVIVNEYPYDNPKAKKYMQLAGMLKRFKQASDSNQIEAIVTISPANNVPHQIIVRVMDACSMAGLEGINFAFPGGD